jgi:hypothetical protein
LAVKGSIAAQAQAIKTNYTAKSWEVTTRFQVRFSGSGVMGEGSNDPDSIKTILKRTKTDRYLRLKARKAFKLVPCFD